ncbi:putative Spore coat protein H [Paratrimastix pyriformis]|uniref:Spore coat protein H n=1 Tax=Paratrimastix pyriformis TaxID=342808 RepID=A0ABQ8UHU1_9EUKA|nr:putative Spore coat protein H [Paratrimastix pyriformis]
MMMRWALLFVAVALASPNPDNAKCWEQCPDLGYPAIPACGNDGKDHNLPYNFWNCMIYCEGIAPRYPGTCKCPNQCSSHGICSSDGCTCQPGWKGADCSIVTCPNACSGHGKCDARSNGDFCKCAPGFTGSDCSAPVVPLEPLQYTVNDPAYWTGKDQYGDDHPLLNRTEMATIKITVAEEDLAMLLQPENAFNQSYVRAKCVLENNNIHFSIDDAGFRLHGFSTRLSSKKSWALSFDKFNKGRLLYGLTGLKLNGERTDPTVTREVMALDVYRAMSIPTPRVSYAEVWVNSVYHGLYLMMEDVDEVFLAGHMGSTSGQLYKCRSGASLDFRGTDPQDYEGQTSYYLNQTWHLYELDSKPQKGDYADVAKLATAINASTPAVFIEQVDGLFGMDGFVRSMVLEVALAQVDAYAYNGNNFRLYHHTDGKVYWLPFDFDVSQGSCVEFPPGDPWTRDWAHQNVYSWGYFSDQSICGGHRPLMTRMLETPVFRQKFNAYFHKLLSTTLSIRPDLMPRQCAPAGVTDYDSSPLYQRMFATKALISGAHARDQFLLLDNNWTQADFEQGFCNPTVHTVPATGAKDTLVRWEEQPDDAIDSPFRITLPLVRSSSLETRNLHKQVIVVVTLVFLGGQVPDSRFLHKNSRIFHKWKTVKAGPTSQALGE